MVLCQNRSMPKVWIDNGGSQHLIFMKPHSCSRSPPCTIIFCCSVPQTNKQCLCFCLTPLFCFYKDFSSLAQKLFCLLPDKAAQFSFLFYEQWRSVIFDSFFFSLFLCKLADPHIPQPREKHMFKLWAYELWIFQWQLFLIAVFIIHINQII